jgi:hypothetical protein
MKTFGFLLTLDRESTDRCFLYACYGNPMEEYGISKASVFRYLRSEKRGATVDTDASA